MVNALHTKNQPKTSCNLTHVVVAVAIAVAVVELMAAWVKSKRYINFWRRVAAVFTFPTRQQMIYNIFYDFSQ